MPLIKTPKFSDARLMANLNSQNRERIFYGEQGAGFKRHAQLRMHETSESYSRNRMGMALPAAGNVCLGILNIRYAAGDRMWNISETVSEETIIDSTTTLEKFVARGASFGQCMVAAFRIADMMYQQLEKEKLSVSQPETPTQAPV